MLDILCLDSLTFGCYDLDILNVGYVAWTVWVLDMLCLDMLSVGDVVVGYVGCWLC